MGDFTHTSDSAESQSTREQIGFTATMTLPDGRRSSLSGCSLDCVAYEFGGYVLNARGMDGILWCSWGHRLYLQKSWPFSRSSEAIIDVNLSTLCDASANPREIVRVTGTFSSTESYDNDGY